MRQKDLRIFSSIILFILIFKMIESSVYVGVIILRQIEDAATLTAHRSLTVSVLMKEDNLLHASYFLLDLLIS